MSNQEQPQRQVLRLHGRTHTPGGSDPIPNLERIRFDTDNEGGWLEIVANDFAAFLGADRGIGIWDATGEGLIIGSGSPAGTGSLIELTDSLPIRIFGLAGVGVALPAGTSFLISGPGGSIFRVDADGTIHIPTGGTIVADL